MPSVSLTTTPVTLDSGASESVWVNNTGTTIATIANGVQKAFILPGRSLSIHVAGTVTAYVLAENGGTGAIYYDLSAPNPGQRLVQTSDLAPGLAVDGGTL